MQTARPPALHPAGDGGNPSEGSGSDAEQRVQSAYQQGRAAGEAAGEHRAGHRLDPVLAGLNSVIRELSGARQRLRMEAEEDTVRLAVAIARRVLHRELATDPEAILGLVKAAFGKLNTREIHRLRVSPADAEAIQEYGSRLELPPGLKVHGEAALTRGSAIFETSRGDLDASVDTQLFEIERGLADVMRRRAR